MSRAPVVRAICWAARCPRSLSASDPNRMTADSPARRRPASLDDLLRGNRALRLSLQDPAQRATAAGSTGSSIKSLGAIKVTTPPGGASDAAHRFTHGRHYSGGRLEADHMRGHRSGERFDVGGEWRIESKVPRCMVTDDVDDRRVRAPGVMQIRQPIGQAGTQVQQRQGRCARHTRITVGCACTHAFEKPKNRADAGHLVQRPHQGQLGRPGVGEADANAQCVRRIQQRPRAVGRCAH